MLESDTDRIESTTSKTRAGETGQSVRTVLMVCWSAPSC